jgi:WD40 repeat protein
MPWCVTAETRQILRSDSCAVRAAGPAAASGAWGTTIRLWDLNTGAETARLETDALYSCMSAMSAGRVVGGDNLGRLHWLEVVD